jgi:hypothetical protein
VIFLRRKQDGRICDFSDRSFSLSVSSKQLLKSGPVTDRGESGRTYVVLNILLEVRLSASYEYVLITNSYYYDHLSGGFEATARTLVHASGASQLRGKSLSICSTSLILVRPHPTIVP